jgi:hypothetical protein
MPAVVVQALKRHRSVQEHERGLADGNWHETGLVFTTATGRHVEPRNLNTAFARLIVRAGVRPIRFMTCGTRARPCCWPLACRHGWSWTSSATRRSR